MAVNCWVAPMAMEKLDGVMLIETRVAGVTVKRVEPLTGPDVAVIVVDPTATPVPSPDADIVAMLPAVEDHTAVAVMSLALPSV